MKKTNNPAAVALGRLGGAVKSAKKSAAARKNGAKGGAPKKNFDLNSPVSQRVTQGVKNKP